MGAPWEDEPVSTFAPRDGWVFWTVGLDRAGRDDVAAQVPGGENDDHVIDLVRTQDERAQANGRDRGAGPWFPRHLEREAVATLLVRTYPHRGDVDTLHDAMLDAVGDELVGLLAHAYFATPES